MIVYEVPDLFENDLIHDQSAVKSSISVANILLSRKSPMLGNLISQMEVVFDDSPAPLSVSIENKLFLHVNIDKWWHITSNQDLADLLLHEALHIAQNHPVRFDNSKEVNLSTDLAINQFDALSNSRIIKSSGVTLENISRFTTWGGQLEEKQSADYYLSKFIPNDKKNNSNNNGTNNSGDQEDSKSNSQQGENQGDKESEIGQEHLSWNKSSENADQTILNALQFAISSSGDEGRGLITEELQEKIDQKGKVFQLPTLKKGINDFTKHKISSATKRTFYKYTTPRSQNVLRRGTKKMFSTPVTIDIFLDSSGSISIEQLSDDLISIKRANEKQKNPIFFDIHYFDTKVY
ncbi:MAG: hypothetical protein LBM27_06035, partial [Lactobacillaceae bacterium]|nr:hypothetical protein [Lactobacillaceae bacterium]